jgi:hypothetical protein
MRPVVPSELHSIKGGVDDLIAQCFDSDRDREIAGRANDIVHDILSQPPIGWNVGTTMKEYNDACYKAVEDRYLQENPPGFVGTLLFGAIISGIISWVVRRWLDHMFPAEN